MSETKKIKYKFIKYFKNYIFWIRSQLVQINSGGSRVLIRKICDLFLLLLALPIILFIRLLEPWVIVHLRSLHSGRIGHFALNTEVYLCERDFGIYNKKIIDIFYHQEQISNYQLKKMWDRTLRVCFFSRFTKIASRLNYLLPGYNKNNIPRDSDIDVHGLLSVVPAHLAFTVEEENMGSCQLKDFGILNGAQFVCLHARESPYLGNVFPENNWDYHNYRDSAIANYIPAAQELTKKGYFVIRMGTFAKNKLSTDNPMIIDYAFKFRSDFLDIYLGAKCQFFIGSCTGITAIPVIFRRPMLLVNFIPLGYMSYPNQFFLFIPKKLFLRKEGRFMPFREIFALGAEAFYLTEQYEKAGIDVIENTPEEITDAALEMDKRVKGLWQESQGDKELQQRFWAVFKNKDFNNKKIAAQVGSIFLRKNKKLLD